MSVLFSFLLMISDVL